MKVIVTVNNDLVTDQRVERSCNVLYDLGYELLLIGRKLNNKLPLKRKYKTKRIKLIFNKKAFFYAEYNIRLFFYLLFHKTDILFVNDLDVLLANTFVAKFKKIPIIYDSHEYFCGMPELINKNFIRNFWKKIERFCVPKVNDMITVNQSIAKLYNKEYNINVEVVRNVPYKYKFDKINSEKYNDIKINSPYIIYQGAVNVERGLKETIDAMQFVENYQFVIAGVGDILKDLINYVSTLTWKDKIIFLGQLPPDKLKIYTVNATLGISPENDCCINYHFSLPNKFFDYINSNIPVLVSNLIEMANIVKKYNIGEIIQSHDAQILAQQINNMLKNNEQLKIYKENTKIAAQDLCWEKESDILKKIFIKYL